MSLGYFIPPLPRVTIKDISFPTDENPRAAFSRLPLAVEKVDKLTFQSITKATSATNLPWIGWYDLDLLMFKMIETSWAVHDPLRLIVEGRIAKERQGATIRISLDFSWITIFLIATLYIASVMVPLLSFLLGTWNVWAMVLWLAIVPGLGTYFLIQKIRKIEEKLAKLFGVGIALR